MLSDLLTLFEMRLDGLMVIEVLKALPFWDSSLTDWAIVELTWQDKFLVNKETEYSLMTLFSFPTCSISPTLVSFFHSYSTCGASVTGVLGPAWVMC